MAHSRPRLRAAETAAGAGGGSRGQNGGQDTGQDNARQVFTSPQNLFQLRYEYKTALRDADFQAALIEQINQQWAAGGGLRIIAPTGPDNITSGKWQMMPIVGARTMLQ